MTRGCVNKAINIVGGSGSLNTIYSANATLTDNRVVTANNKNLTFDMGSGIFTVSGVVTTKGINLVAVSVNPGNSDTVWVSGMNLFYGAEPLSTLPVATEGSGSVSAKLSYLTPINVTGASSTVTPPTPLGANSRFELVDSRANSPTNNILVDFIGAGQKLYGSTSQNYTLNSSGAFVRFRYLNSTIGWIVEK